MLQLKVILHDSSSTQGAILKSNIPLLTTLRDRHNKGRAMFNIKELPCINIRSSLKGGKVNKIFFERRLSLDYFFYILFASTSLCNKYSYVYGYKTHFFPFRRFIFAFQKVSYLVFHVALLKLQLAVKGHLKRIQLSLVERHLSRFTRKRWPCTRFLNAMIVLDNQKSTNIVYLQAFKSADLYSKEISR